MVSLPDRRTASVAAALTFAVILGGRFATAQEPVPTPFGAVVEVSRILTEVRVVDRSGEPVQGLTVDDFQVSVDGQPVTVESVAWVPTSGDLPKTPAATPGVTAGPTLEQVPEPRLIVIVFQSDINLYRLKGLVRMAPEAAAFVRNLDPDDLVALFAFESHLEMRSDFTADHEAVADMLNTTEILNGRMEPPSPAPTSLAASFDAEKAGKAATLTRALEVIGRSLIPIPGPKTVVLFGWGLGRYNVGHPIIQKHSYGEAIAMLAAARASVFSLDITTADYHTLERGLRRVSHDTGGLYIKTNRFPGTAIAKLTRMITSYYELAIVPPPDLAEAYEIKVKVKRPATEVYVRQNTLARY
jgi:VWFA-related protein